MSVRAGRVACLALLLCACQSPAAAPIGSLLGPGVQRVPQLPDALDRAAADVAVATLAGATGPLREALARLENAEADRAEPGRGEPAKRGRGNRVRRVRAGRGMPAPSTLVGLAHEAAHTRLAPGRAERDAARRLLERRDLDPAQRERLEQWLADDPLLLARRRVREARFGAVARFFNSFSAPASTFFYAPVLPIAVYRIGHSFVNYTIDAFEEDALTLQRRQALAHWKEFRARHPDAEESAALAGPIAKYEDALKRTRYEQAWQRARRARREGRLRSALLHTRTALRERERAEARELLAEIEDALAREARLRNGTLESDAALELSEGEPKQILAALTAQPGLQPTLHPTPQPVPPGPAPPQREDEVRFREATRLARASDDAAWDVLAELAERPASPMGRHAEALIVDPERHPYRSYRVARRAERRRSALALWLGPLVAAPEPSVAGGLRYLIDLPLRIQQATLLPLRLLQWPWRGTTRGDAEAAVYARRYLALHPHGRHTADVRDWLASFELRRGNHVGALRVLEDAGEADAAELDALRERAAEQAERVAASEQRSEMRAALLMNVARTFPETRAGRRAGRIAREQALEQTPHEIRLSRGFLVENPGVAGPRGLDLAPELLDDDPRNAELHPDGVALIGGRRIALFLLDEAGDEDAPPLRREASLGKEKLARLVANLEEASFRNSLLDEDDALVANPRRDLWIERARLGLTADVDDRAGAEARHAYRGMRERYGMVRGREAFLPVELVVQGSLRDLTLGAFPRLRPPKPTPDALLYR